MNELYLVDDGYAKPCPYFAKSFASAMEMYLMDNYCDDDHLGYNLFDEDDYVKITNSKGEEKKFQASIEQVYKCNIEEVE